jgi:predicted transcriptional regulator
MGLKENLTNETVSQLPCREAIRIPPEATVREAVEILQSKQLGCAVVVDEADKPLGVFTERTLIDLLLQQPENLDSLQVRDHLEAEWFCVQTTDPIARVLDLVQNRGARFVVELDDAGKVKGLTGQKGLSEYIADHFPEQVMVQRIGGQPGMETREGA